MDVLHRERNHFVLLTFCGMKVIDLQINTNPFNPSQRDLGNFLAYEVDATVV